MEKHSISTFFFFFGLNELFVWLWLLLNIGDFLLGNPFWCKAKGRAVFTTKRSCGWLGVASNEYSAIFQYWFHPRIKYSLSKMMVGRRSFPFGAQGLFSGVNSLFQISGV